MSGILKQIAKNSSSVHITMTPVPRSIGESKQILSALQKFGEVATFRNLKYDTSNKSPRHASHAIAIYDNPEAASRAISCGRITMPSPSPSPSAVTVAEAEVSSPVKVTEITCRIDQSHHNHSSSLKRNPYHTTFEIEKDSSFRDLLRSGVPLRELADGRTRQKGFVARGVKRGVQAENVRWGATSLWGLYES